MQGKVGIWKAKEWWFNCCELQMQCKHCTKWRKREDQLETLNDRWKHETGCMWFPYPNAFAKIVHFGVEYLDKELKLRKFIM